MTISLDEETRAYLLREKKATGYRMSAIIKQALSARRKQKEINLFEMLNDLEDKLSMFIQQIEAERDYNNREYTPSEAEVYEMFNTVFWDIIRKLKCFRETPKERQALAAANGHEQWLKEHPYIPPDLPE